MLSREEEFGLTGSKTIVSEVIGRFLNDLNHLESKLNRTSIILTT